MIFVGVLNILLNKILNYKFMKEDYVYLIESKTQDSTDIFCGCVTKEGAKDILKKIIKSNKTETFAECFDKETLKLHSYISPYIYEEDEEHFKFQLENSDTCHSVEYNIITMRLYKGIDETINKKQSYNVAVHYKGCYRTSVEAKSEIEAVQLVRQEIQELSDLDFLDSIELDENGFDVLLENNF